MKKTLSLILALIIVLSILSGCSKASVETTGAADTKPVETTAPTTAPTETTAPPDPEAIWYTANDVTEIPDYEGDPLTVNVWYGVWSPSGGLPGYPMELPTSGRHVVNEELKRITGVEPSADNSFTRDEPTREDMLAKLIANNDLPDILHSSRDVHHQLAKDGYLWDLQNLITKENTPLLYSLIGPENPVYGNVWKNLLQQDGGIYIFEPGLSASTTTCMMAQEDPETFANWKLTNDQMARMNFRAFESDKQFVFVKQEYLDQLFPGCHTNASWKALYEEKGELTPEDLLDIPINSNADFEKMLYDIKAIIDADGSSKYVWASRNGTDNWSFYCQHSFVWGHQTNYTSYFDLAAGEIKKSLEQDFWKEQVKQVNKWYRDGILDPDAYGYTFEDYKSHVASGDYAVVMWDFTPASCGYENQDTDYRRVFLNYSATSNKDILVGMICPVVSLTNSVSLVKGGNLDTDEKVIQFLKYVEFQLTEAGSKLRSFGPPELGMYTETEDGTIIAAGELAALGEGLYDSYSIPVKELQGKYGLHGYAWPMPLGNGLPIHNWKAIDNSPFKLETYLTPSIMFPAEPRLGSNGCAVHSDVALNNGNQGLDNWWYARMDWEAYMTKAELAQSDEEFETRYQEMLDYIAEVGFDDAALEQFNKDYTTKYADYIKLEQERNANR